MYNQVGSLISIRSGQLSNWVYCIALVLRLVRDCDEQLFGETHTWRKKIT